MQEISHQALWEKLNRETAKIAWQDLAGFYAAGQVVFIDESLDLIETAAQFSLDNKALVADLLAQQKVSVVQEDLAQRWSLQNTQLWAVVVAPWVLVQNIKEKKHEGH